MVLERLSLAGRTAIVTGAGRGLGRAIALALADAGADVACAARTQAEIDATAAAIAHKGRRALALPTDVTQPDQVDRLVRMTVAAWGAVHVFVANAGGVGAITGKDVTQITDQEWAENTALNLSSVFYCARAVVPHLRDQGSGAIITVATRAALRGAPGMLAYASAKGGVITFTRSLAMQLAPDNIRVNGIAPGFLITESNVDAADTAVTSERAGRLPVRSVGEAWEVGPLALYLASDASSYVTGQIFFLDGGALAAGYAPADWEFTLGGRGE